MKQLKKSFALCLLLSSFALAGSAGEEGVTFLFRNGAKASFTFEKKPCLAMTADGLSVTAEGESMAQFLFSDVQRYYFDDNIETDVKSLRTNASASPVFRYENGTITVSGMKPGELINAVTVSGKMMSSVRADGNGCARINLSGMPKGVYVIATSGGVSCKIVNR